MDLLILKCTYELLLFALISQFGTFYRILSKFKWYILFYFSPNKTFSCSLCLGLVCSVCMWYFPPYSSTVVLRREKTCFCFIRITKSDKRLYYSFHATYAI